MVLKNRKALKLVVCMSLIVALAISALSLSVWAIYENTHANSGDQAADIVSIAQTQVGYGEDYSGYTKYGDWYGLPNSDWCAMFVSWCANQAGVDASVFPSFALCSAGCDWFMSQGRFHYSGSYVPQPGDLIFYASYGSIYHVGLVTGSDGSNVYSIEGNYSDMVSNVSYSLGYGDILGYASPDYSSSGVVFTAEDEEEDSDEETYVFEESSEEDEETVDVTEDFEEEEIADETTDSEEEEIIDVTTDSEEEEIAEEATDFEEEEIIDVTTDSEEEEIAEEATDSEEEEIADEATDSEEEETVELTTDVDSETDSEEDTETSGVTLLGDVNEDEEVDSIDALLVQRYLVLDKTSDVVNAANGDVNGSGDLDIGDALAILKMSIGLR